MINLERCTEHIHTLYNNKNDQPRHKMCVRREHIAKKYEHRRTDNKALLITDFFLTARKE